MFASVATINAFTRPHTGSPLSFGEWNKALLDKLKANGLAVHKVQRSCPSKSDCAFDIYAQHGTRAVRIRHSLQEQSAIYVRLTVEEEGCDSPLMQYSMRVCPGGELEHTVARTLSTMTSRLDSFSRLLCKALN